MVLGLLRFRESELLLNILRYNLRIPKNERITTITAINGAKSDNILRKVEKTPSNALITGLPIPAVIVVLAARAALVEVAIVAAVPPPAIIAKVQLYKGSMSPTTVTMARVPATVASGIEMVSNTLSKYGIK